MRLVCHLQPNISAGSSPRARAVRGGGIVDGAVLEWPSAKIRPRNFCKSPFRENWTPLCTYPEAASPVRLVRPRPDHFSAGRWSHFQTAETVCQRDGWARCPTQARLCPACRRFSYKSFPLFCQQIMQEPGAARPDCIGTHVLLNTHAYTTCSC